MARERGTRYGPRDPAVTSRMMAAVRNKDSKAELAFAEHCTRLGCVTGFTPATFWVAPT